MFWAVFLGSLFLVTLIVAIVKGYNKGRQIGGFGSPLMIPHLNEVLSKKIITKAKRSPKIAKKKKETRINRKG